MSEKICFVVQRYGLEVNGGAELLCRLFAEKMLKFYPEIEVLTSRAIDYMSWKNEYKSDSEKINGVTVRRFGVVYERTDDFHKINAEFMKGTMASDREMEWIEKQGPFCPDLIEYLKIHQQEFRIIVFFTYLYYPTVVGIKSISQKSIVMPFAHDEPFLKMKVFADVFKKPNGIVYSTSEEKELINSKYKNENLKSCFGGSGVDLPQSIDAKRFKVKYNLQNYIIYVGRIDEAKNCKQLFDYFLEYKKRNQSDLKLVLMGKPVMQIPESDDIVSLGFVSDEDKFDGIKGAISLVLPSKFESLSMVVLEAMAVRTPVMVYGECEVLKGHCKKSNGAFYYNDYFEFEGELNYLMENPEIVEKMKDNALAYVNENYSWDKITERFHNLIEEICGE